MHKLNDERLHEDVCAERRCVELRGLEARWPREAAIRGSWALLNKPDCSSG